MIAEGKPTFQDLCQEFEATHFESFCCVSISLWLDVPTVPVMATIDVVDGGDGGMVLCRSRLGMR
jgi:hypothetical protein